MIIRIYYYRRRIQYLEGWWSKVGRRRFWLSWLVRLGKRHFWWILNNRILNRHIICRLEMFTLYVRNSAVCHTFWRVAQIADFHVAPLYDCSPVERISI